MTLAEIRLALATLNAATEQLEDLYEESEGEVTEETITEEERIATLRELLEGDGIDSLGRWLKSKEDEAAALKAEKQHIERRQKAVENSVDFIKGELYNVLRSLNIEKAKGTSYGFTAQETTKTIVDKERLAEWGPAVDKAIRDAGIPAWIGVTLKASVSAVPEGQPLPDLFQQETRQSVKFTKPRKPKEDVYENA